MIFRLLLRQTINSWRQLGIWYQLQNFLLWGFVILTASYYLLPFVKNWQQKIPNFHLILANGLIVYFVVASAVNLKGQVAKQLPLSVLRSLPFSGKHLFSLFTYYLHRNWRWGWLLFLILLIVEFRLSTQIAVTFLILFLLLVASFTFLFLAAFLRFYKSRPSLISLALSLILLGSVSLISYQVPEISFWVTVLQIPPILVIAAFWASKINLQLEDIYPLIQKDRLKRALKPKVQFSQNRWFALLRKEIHSVWRHRPFRNSKIFMLLAIILFGPVIFKLFKQPVTIFTLSVLFLVWWHYSQFFTPQFGQKEPEWFFKTLPLPFGPYFSARFFAEFWFVLLVLIAFSLTLHLNGIPLTEHWQLLLALFLASIAILIFMIAFQIIFFDDPKTAGFTFYFSVLFFFVLTLWDHFLGPLTCVVFLIFYLVKSYRFFRS